MKKIIRVMGSSVSMNTQLRGQLNYLNNYFKVIAIADDRSNYLSIISKREKVNTISIQIERGISVLRDFVSLIKLCRVFFKEKPFIVHASSPKAVMLSMIASYICRVPNRIYTVTGLRYETTTGFLKKTLVTIEKINCFCATKIIPEGEGVKKRLLKDNITKKPLSIILNGNINGIDLTHYNTDSLIKSKSELRDDYSLPVDSFVFIFVGRLVRDKGIDELINAFQLIYNKYNCYLQLVGEFEEIDPVDIEVKKLINANPRILSHGYQEDIRPFLKASDVFVFPSYREGFPNVVLQAGAMGLPAIVTDISGSNEIIMHKNNGIVINSKSVHELADAMELFILKKKDDMFGFNTMGINARNNIENKYEQKMLWKAILDDYLKLQNGEN